MAITLLDASLAGLAELILIGYMLVVTLVEAVVMLVFKFNPFGKCLLDAFLVNLASLGVGYLISSSYNITLGGDSYTSLLVAFIVTLIIEGLLLQLLNRKKSPKKVWQVNILMNAITYAGILVIFILSNAS
ncbi:MAG: hypothetical protein ACHQEB_03385 [Chitinophagales bacterium]